MEQKQINETLRRNVGVLSEHTEDEIRMMPTSTETPLPSVEDVKQIVSLIKQAKRSITLIDNYIDETTLTMLSKRDANVSATIYTSKLSQNLRQLKLDIERHNQQYPPIDINICQRNHDRFLIVDDVVYLFGASLKDAGKKLFAYIKMQETPATELLCNIR